MPDYAQTSHLNVTCYRPALYWTGKTPMRSMADCIGTTGRHAYAHHIQRQMVTGNYALLAGVVPAQIEAWYLAVCADAYEWVELPNVHGMVMHADGGRMVSKPCAASGTYIDRMSDYCKGCALDPKDKLGAKACRFNYLYWNFHIENDATLSKNPRIALPFGTLSKMPTDQRAEIKRASEGFLEGPHTGPQDESPIEQPRLGEVWR